MESLAQKSIDNGVMCTEVESNWMTPLKEYILNGSLPEDPKAARNILTSAACYVIIKTSCIEQWKIGPS